MNAPSLHYSGFRRLSLDANKDQFTILALHLTVTRQFLPRFDDNYAVYDHHLIPSYQASTTKPSEVAPSQVHKQTSTALNQGKSPKIYEMWHSLFKRAKCVNPNPDVDVCEKYTSQFLTTGVPVIISFGYVQPHFPPLHDLSYCCASH